MCMGSNVVQVFKTTISDMHLVRSIKEKSTAKTIVFT